jgi:hypothetical protein
MVQMQIIVIIYILTKTGSNNRAVIGRTDIVVTAIVIIVRVAVSAINSIPIFPGTPSVSSLAEVNGIIHPIAIVVKILSRITATIAIPVSGIRLIPVCRPSTPCSCSI